MVTTESAVQVKTRPIIFGSESVRAILAGRKTQTRRVIKNPDKYDRIRECGFCCPYGQPGERLWVRERWMYVGPGSGSDLPSYVEEARATVKTPANCWYYADYAETMNGISRDAYAWQSPLFLPRTASRLILVLISVRVERLREITERDAEAEGVRVRDVLYADEPQSAYSYVEQYKLAWDSLNAKRGFPWDSNPWVFVIEFKRLESAV